MSLIAIIQKQRRPPLGAQLLWGKQIGSNTAWPTTALPGDLAVIRTIDSALPADFTLQLQQSYNNIYRIGTKVCVGGENLLVGNFPGVLFLARGADFHYADSVNGDGATLHTMFSVSAPKGSREIILPRGDQTNFIWVTAARPFYELQPPLPSPVPPIYVSEVEGTATVESRFRTQYSFSTAQRFIIKPKTG